MEKLDFWRLSGRIYAESPSICSSIRTPNSGGSRTPDSNLPTEHQPDPPAILKNLEPGQTVYLDVTGEVHDDRTGLLRPTTPPLAALRKEKSGAFRVYSGRPPSNRTYCGSGTTPTSSELARHRDNQAPVVLTSGGWIALTPKVVVRIPNSTLFVPCSAAEKLTELVGSTRSRETVILGRTAVPECPREMSRSHITIKVIERAQTAQHHINLKALAVPGVEGAQPIYEVKTNGQLEQIVGYAIVPPDALIQLGDHGPRVALPPKKRQFSKSATSLRATPDNRRGSRAPVDCRLFRAHGTQTCTVHRATRVCNGGS